ncbi:23S rRNA (adenine(2503)-C(2))-methyltransferase RlmN [Thermohalobacter berrensis]|uniref:23S rRNA (adenine(2503)-C(2))-methyltransferase RlmN n=1 Tax=Thermohalobacter berrensis TaxID=99594 RepID=UPI00242E9430|nr:23S rRNA (adenine(2503)-C(2))-methyltransferase RlmN [Thermohalobacter berrensis]
MNKIDLKSFNLEELKKLMVEIGEKSFRGQQIFNWIHQKNVESFQDITVLSKELRDKLENKYKITNLKIFKRFDSKIDNTKKYLFLLEDGNIIESVMMEYKHGVSVCLSTQVGCKMGCTFCASTKDGLIRNLTTGEILDQVYKIQKDLNIKVSNIVLMGSGEPLDNYENVLKFLRIINHKHGQNIGYRHITLSTCGIVPNIYKLADEKLPITLSISLHATNDNERKKVMPITYKYSISEVIKACKYYIEKVNRRVTFEYTLIKGVNDTKENAKKLANLLKGMLCHVNLIPLNPIKEVDYRSSNKKSVKNFKRELENRGIKATIRREMGRDINAACGQLRRKYMESKKD